jgi:Kef-type K+ transport system membrane component KefB
MNVSLPLNNPVLIFALILFIILIIPMLLSRWKVPPIIGMILAGAVIGPNGLNLILRDNSIILFGTVGLLYIMFLAGLEINLTEFKKNSTKSIIFGLYTFLIPMIMGITVSIYFLQFPVLTSVLLASMFASHTLLVYPIISRLGVLENRAVNVAIGGTMITDTLALLVLAIVVGLSTGVINDYFWLKLIFSLIAFGLIVIFLLPVMIRWFFKKFEDNISQFIFVLATVFLAAFLAEAAGIEAIIGAFFAGLVLNRFIPNVSPLMNRIEFVGNALFIPFFLIGVGMLIDYKSFLTDPETITVAITMTIIATAAKFLAAWATQRTFRFTVDERRLIFGLSNAQAAATLAAVLVGYNVIIGVDAAGEPVRLLGESILNGAILMILVTCTVASFVAQKGAENIALLNEKRAEVEDGVKENFLIPVSNMDNVSELINLSLLLKAPGKSSTLYALNVINNSRLEEEAEAKGQKVLKRALVTAAAADEKVVPLLRYDSNILNAIISSTREYKITDLILGLHDQAEITDSFFGSLTEGIISTCNLTTIVYKKSQPLATINRHIVVVPQNAEREEGFPLWMKKILNIASNTGDKIVFYASAETKTYIMDFILGESIDSDFVLFNDWNDFLILARDLQPDDNLIVLMSRPNQVSYSDKMTLISHYLNKYFREFNFLIIYPLQNNIIKS